MCPDLEYGVLLENQFCLQQQLETVQNQAARFVTFYYSDKNGSMTGILEKLLWEYLRKRSSRLTQQ